MALSDSSKDILNQKMVLIKESIDRLSALIDDYAQRIGALQTEMNKRVAEKQALIQQLSDLKTDTGTQV